MTQENISSHNDKLRLTDIAIEHAIMIAKYIFIIKNDSDKSPPRRVT